MTTKELNNFNPVKKPDTTIYHPLTTITPALLLLTLVIMALTACLFEEKDSVTLKQNYVILDFENEEQLDELSWKCGTTYELSREHAATGQYSLKIEMYPKVTWPGFGKGIKKSWAGYNYLSINIFNPAPETVQLSYRIDDRHDNPPYNDRANGRLLIVPGTNLISFNLKELKTSDSKRHLNLNEVCSLLLFLHNPNQKTTLYLDDLTLSNIPTESK